MEEAFPFFPEGNFFFSFIQFGCRSHVCGDHDLAEGKDETFLVQRVEGRCLWMIAWAVTMFRLCSWSTALARWFEVADHLWVVGLLYSFLPAPLALSPVRLEA
eukprot:Gb_05483 [translate_table: standard]